MADFGYGSITVFRHALGHDRNAARSVTLVAYFLDIRRVAITGRLFYGALDGVFRNVATQALSIAVRSREFPSGSAPPMRAETEISRSSLVNSLPRLAS